MIWVIFIKKVEEFNLNKIRKILNVFNGMIADMLSNKKHNPIVAEFLVRGRKLNIFIVLTTQFYSAAPKIIRQNLIYYFVIKIPSKREHQQSAFTHSSNIDFQDFINL